MYRRFADAHQSLNRATLVDPPTNFDKVTIGTRVKIVRDSEEMMWEIVASSTNSGKLPRPSTKSYWNSAFRLSSLTLNVFLPIGVPM
ncbi:MAG: hypothetical protein ABH818_02570 [Patescibacteria group bacterium]